MTAARSGAPANEPGRLRWDSALLLAAVVLQGGLAVWLGRDGWFDADLLHRYLERGGAPGGSEGVMDPQGGQWVSVAVVVHVLLFKVVGLTSYVPYLVLAVALHLGLVVASHRALVRLGAGRGAALVAALVLLTYGAGSAVFLSAAGVSRTVPLLLGTLALLALLGRGGGGSPLRAGLLLLVAVATSWTGLVATVWVALFALRSGIRAAATVVGPPVVGLLVWYVGWGRGSLAESLAVGDLGPATPVEVVMAMASSVDGVLGGWGIGAAALLAVVAAVVTWRRSAPELAHWAGAGMAAALLAATGTEVLRPTGLPGAAANDTRYVGLVLLVPALAVLLDGLATAVLRTRGPGPRRALVAAACVAAGAVVVSGVVVQQQTGETLGEEGERARDLLAGTLEATQSGEKVLSDVVGERPVRGGQLARLADPDLAPELPTLRATEQDRLDAESSFFVAVTADEVELAPPVEVRSDSFSRRIATRRGCRTYTAVGSSPAVTVVSYLGAGFRFRGGAESVTTWLSRPDEAASSAPVEWETAPGTWTRVATTAQVAELTVTFDAGGDYTFCFSD